MSKKKKKTTTTRDKFARMTVDQIFAAWEDAARGALTPGQKYAPEIFAPRGVTVRKYKRSITRRQADTAHPFNAADFRSSTRVARDIGRICSIMAAAEPRGVVTLDVFQHAETLAQVHAACPIVTAGAGRWCEP